MDYPADILIAAERALDAVLCNCAESCGGTAGVRAASIDDIAKAIAAEREACAEVADGYSQVSGTARVVGLNIGHMIRLRNNYTR